MCSRVQLRPNEQNWGCGCTIPENMQGRLDVNRRQVGTGSNTDDHACRLQVASCPTTPHRASCKPLSIQPKPTAQPTKQQGVPHLQLKVASWSTRPTQLQAGYNPAGCNPAARRLRAASSNPQTATDQAAAPADEGGQLVHNIRHI